MKRLRLTLLLLTSPFLLYVQCVTGTRLNPPQPTQSSWTSAAIADEEYQLGFGDVLEIKLFNNQRFNQTATVRPDGRITLERIGDIRVTGMTSAELDSLITEKYAKFIRSPEVTVIVQQFGASNFYILGEVRKPGGYPLEQDATIMQALALAGGTTDQAEIKSLIIIRPIEYQKVVAFRVDFKQLLQGQATDVKEAYYLKAKDVIYVPKTYIANISSFVLQLYDLALPPVDIYLKALWWRGR